MPARTLRQIITELDDAIKAKQTKYFGKLVSLDVLNPFCITTEHTTLEDYIGSGEQYNPGLIRVFYGDGDIANAVDELATAISAGAKETIVDIVDEDGLNVLHHAAKTADIDAIKALLGKLNPAEKIKALATQTTKGNTVLHFAANIKDDQDAKKTIEALLEGINILDTLDAINTRNNAGAAPLHFAANRLHDTTIGFLVENGAKPSLETYARNKADRKTARHIYEAASEQIAGKRINSYDKIIESQTQLALQKVGLQLARSADAGASAAGAAATPAKAGAAPKAAVVVSGAGAGRGTPKASAAPKTAVVVPVAGASRGAPKASAAPKMAAASARAGAAFNGASVSSEPVVVPVPNLSPPPPPPARSPRGNGVAGRGAPKAGAVPKTAAAGAAHNTPVTERDIDAARIAALMAYIPPPFALEEEGQAPTSHKEVDQQNLESSKGITAAGAEVNSGSAASAAALAALAQLKDVLADETIYAEAAPRTAALAAARGGGRAAAGAGAGKPPIKSILKNPRTAAAGGAAADDIKTAIQASMDSIIAAHGELNPRERLMSPSSAFREVFKDFLSKQPWDGKAIAAVVANNIKSRIKALKTCSKRQLSYKHEETGATALMAALALPVTVYTDAYQESNAIIRYLIENCDAAVLAMTDKNGKTAWDYAKIRDLVGHTNFAGTIDTKLGRGAAARAR